MDDQNPKRAFESQLSKAFGDIQRQRNVTLSMNDAEFRELNQMTMSHRERRIGEEKTYRATYSTRVADETKRLMQKDGQKSPEHKPSFGMDDRFNGGRLNLQAQKNVRGQHKIAQATLREAELNDRDAFFQRVEKRNAERGHANHDFNRATDRRNGPERRQMRSSGPKRQR